jgi:predicted AlkP superfamily phosphohydrolase/phosphomutase
LSEAAVPSTAPTSMRRLLPLAALGVAFLLGIGGTLLFQNRSRLMSGRSTEAPPVVLIGLDGADWNIIDPLVAAGKMPNLAGLIGRGSRARLLTISPTLSPVIWTTIATGVKPERHGIVDFTAVNKDTGAAVPVTSNLRRVPALWNILSSAGRTVGFVGWWASFPAEKVNG